MVTRVEANDASTVHCTGVESLPGGQVTTEGTINYGPNEFAKADPYSLPIEGGTGKYRTAHGEIRIQELTTTEWQVTLRIIPQWAPSARACSTRRWLIRCPSRSSIHIRAPPAPQHIPRR
jgi:hypothetical protein